MSTEPENPLLPPVRDDPPKDLGSFTDSSHDQEDHPSTTSFLYGFSLIGNLIASCLRGVGLSSLVVGERTREVTEVENALYQQPLNGLIAYAVADEVRILDASKLPGDQTVIERYQFKRNIDDIVWVDENTLMASWADSSDRSYKAENNRQYLTRMGGIYLIDRTSEGKGSVIYQSRVGKDGDYIEQGPKLFRSSSGKMYAQINDDFYDVPLTAGNLPRPTDQRIDELNDGSIVEPHDRRFHLRTAWGAVELVAEYGKRGIRFEKGSKHAAWWGQKED